MTERTAIILGDSVRGMYKLDLRGWCTEILEVQGEASAAMGGREEPGPFSINMTMFICDTEMRGSGDGRRRQEDFEDRTDTFLSKIYHGRVAFEPNTVGSK